VVKNFPSDAELGVNMPNFFMAPTLKTLNCGTEFSSQCVKGAHRYGNRSPCLLHNIIKPFQFSPKRFKITSLNPSSLVEKDSKWNLALSVTSKVGLWSVDRMGNERRFISNGL
jgi:hypothetical protein